ncbi:hypothetical protein NDA11_001263 [Ustilago hordei]|nr:hypothetical protein NDA11_001263 [Ustilago hordei]
MQAYHSVSSSTSSSQHHQHQNSGTFPPTNASLTIDPAALLGGGPTPTPAPSTLANSRNNSAATPMTLKQEPDDGQSTTFEHHTTHAKREREHRPKATDVDASKQRSISATPRAGNQQDDGMSLVIHLVDTQIKTEKEPATLVDELLQRDHKAILRPDLSPFADARDALRRLLPYHVWNIPHHDLLKALDLSEDPVLSQVRVRKHRRIARLADCKRSEARHTATAPSSSQAQQDDSAQTSAQPGPSTMKADEQQLKEAGAEPKKEKHSEDRQRLNAADHDAALNQLGLPIPLPEVPQPDFPSLDFAESIFARRDALASRFRRTLTALDTAHKRAPNTSLSLEHLERLAYNDDREEVLAQIQELKALKAKLETLEEQKGIDPKKSSAKVNLSFAITDEIEREREKEREIERIKRQQERAAAKAAKLEKERENRHRLGIFTPPPEPPAAPAPVASTTTTTAPSPTSTAPVTPAPAGVVPSTSGLLTSATMQMPSPYSAVSTPASTPGGYPFSPGANLPYAQQYQMSQAGPNGIAMPSPQIGPGSAYSSMPGTPLTPGAVPPFAMMPGAHGFGSQGMPMPPGVAAMGTPTSAPFATAGPSIPGTPATPTATPSKPPSKSKAKAKAAATSGTPGAPGTPGNPGVTPGPTPHRGRGRPRKHPLPGTPGGPPIPKPRNKKLKPGEPGASGSKPATLGTPSGTAMSPPSVPAGAGATAMRPPSASPAPPTMPGPAPGYSGEMFASALPPTPTAVRPPAGSPPASAPVVMDVRPPTMHPTLTSATSLNMPCATPPPSKPSASPSPAPSTAAAATKETPAKSPTPTANGTASAPPAPAPAPSPAPAPAAAPAAANPSIPNHPIPLLIPVASLPRLSALGVSPVPSPHIRPIIGLNGQPQGLQGLPIPIDPAQSVPAVLLGISEGAAEAANGEGKQQILHISVVLSRLSPSQLSGLAVLMQSLQAQVEADKRK